MKEENKEILKREIITYEQIQKANETIATIDVKGKNYAEVNQRIKAFRMVSPGGCITTEILELKDGVVTMRTTVTDANGFVLGTGLAQEKEGSTFINKTSFIENCETSSVGRALGMCGFGIDTSIASAEEVANAINNKNDLDDEWVKLKNEFDKMAIDTETDIEAVNKHYKVTGKQVMNKKQLKEAIETMKKKVNK